MRKGTSGSARNVYRSEQCPIDHLPPTTLCLLLFASLHWIKSLRYAVYFVLNSSLQSGRGWTHPSMGATQIIECWAIGHLFDPCTDALAQHTIKIPLAHHLFGEVIKGLFGARNALESIWKMPLCCLINITKDHLKLLHHLAK